MLLLLLSHRIEFPKIFLFQSIIEPTFSDMFPISAYDFSLYFKFPIREHGSYVFLARKISKTRNNNQIYLSDFYLTPFLLNNGMIDLTCLLN